MPNTQQSGFSLLELIVSVGILTIIMGAAFQLFVRSQVNFDANQMLTEAHANTDFAVNRVAEVTRGAGANPSSAPIISALAYLETPDSTSVRIRSDYNGDGLINARAGGVGGTTESHIVDSEDVTLRWFPTRETYNGVDVPAFSLVMIDNTLDPPGTSPQRYNVPIVVAANVRDFSCAAGGTPVRWADVTVTGGPSRPIPPTDPRYRALSRTVRIRLRNF
jgi:prepilin-type N-terminal cleavage/methylation domain-containing protein